MTTRAERTRLTTPRTSAPASVRRAAGGAAPLIALAFALAFALAGVAGAPPAARAQADGDEGEGLQDLLEEIGGEYAEAYLAPLAQTFGVNQVTALYTTAAIPRQGVTVSIGVKAMNTRLKAADQVFAREFTATLDESYGVLPGHPAYGQTGTIRIAGPTVFGDDDQAGTVQAFHEGALVAEREGIEGAVKTRDVPLAVPELTVGGILGLRATLRWLPTIDAGDDIGEIKLLGYGVQANVNQWLAPLPVDVMVGFFRQSLEVGDALDADASSLYLAASKPFGLLTVYGGAAKESSDLEVDYTYVDRDDPGLTFPVRFAIEGAQESRFTLGVALQIGATLSAEVNRGSEWTTYGAGLAFGF